MASSGDLRELATIVASINPKELSEWMLGGACHLCGEHKSIGVHGMEEGGMCIEG